MRDGTGFIQCVAGRGDIGDARFERAGGPPAGIVPPGDGTGSERRPRAGRLRVSVTGARGRARGRGVPDLAEGARRPFLMDHRHLWMRSSQAVRRPADQGDRHRGGQALLRLEGLPAARHAASSRRPRARARPRSSRPNYFDEKRLPDAERSALQRGDRDGVREGLLLRPGVPRREEQDAAPPDRVLADGAGDRLRRPRRRHGRPGGTRRRIVATVLSRTSGRAGSARAGRRGYSSGSRRRSRGSRTPRWSSA